MILNCSIKMFMCGVSEYYIALQKENFDPDWIISIILNHESLELKLQTAHLSICSITNPWKFHIEIHQTKHWILSGKSLLTRSNQNITFSHVFVLYIYIYPGDKKLMSFIWSCELFLNWKPLSSSKV